MGPGGRNVKGLDLRALICLAQQSTVQRVEGLGGRIADEPCAAGMELLIKSIGILKPRTGVAKIEVKGIGLPWLVIHPVEQVCFITPVVQDRKFRRVEKSARVQGTGGQEVPPVISAVRDIEPRARSTE